MCQGSSEPTADPPVIGFRPMRCEGGNGLVRDQQLPGLESFVLLLSNLNILLLNTTSRVQIHEIHFAPSIISSFLILYPIR